MRRPMERYKKLTAAAAEAGKARAAAELRRAAPQLEKRSLKTEERVGKLEGERLAKVEEKIARLRARQAGVQAGRFSWFFPKWRMNRLEKKIRKWETRREALAAQIVHLKDALASVNKFYVGKYGNAAMKQQRVEEVSARDLKEVTSVLENALPEHSKNINTTASALLRDRQFTVQQVLEGGAMVKKALNPAAFAELGAKFDALSKAKDVPGFLDLHTQFDALRTELKKTRPDLLSVRSQMAAMGVIEDALVTVP